jgi:hypothetical protein
MSLKYDELLFSWKKNVTCQFTHLM